MYILFCTKKWKPSDYYSLPEGEKVVVRAFLKQEIEEIEKETERLKRGESG